MRHVRAARRFGCRRVEPSPQPSGWELIFTHMLWEHKGAQVFRERFSSANRRRFPCPAGVPLRERDQRDRRAAVRWQQVFAENRLLRSPRGLAPARPPQYPRFQHAEVGGAPQAARAARSAQRTISAWPRMFGHRSFACSHSMGYTRLCPENIVGKGQLSGRGLG